MENIVDVEELQPDGILTNELRKIVKKYGVEYQLVIGAKDRSWYSGYEGEGKIINQLNRSSLGYIFLANQNVMSKEEIHDKCSNCKLEKYFNLFINILNDVSDSVLYHLRK